MKTRWAAAAGAAGAASGKATMGVLFKIENEVKLPDGGPLTFRLSGDRGADIGRDAHLDWTLPDPSLYISGKHCEIRCQGGRYWLYDVSTNGTFLNGGDRRLQSPHCLRSGDRLAIGHYIVAIEISDEAPNGIAVPSPEYEGEDLWSGGVDAAPPIDPRDLRPASRSRPVQPDYLDWAIDVPTVEVAHREPRPLPPARPPAPVPRPEASWDSGALPTPAAPEPPPPVPTPRRPIWVGPGPDRHWGGEDAAGDSPLQGDLKAAAPWPEAQPSAVASAPAFEPSRTGADVVARFAKGAGLPRDALAQVEAGDLAERLGRLMLLVTDNVKQLLYARSQTKRLARSSSQTMIAALDNNPLKFSPTAADALRIMMGPRTGGYLDADEALRQGFDDIKSHQIKTFSAMQRALKMLLDDLDPKAVQAAADEGKTAANWLASRGSRLWALYEARWRSKAERHGGGMQDLFMQYFAECYDQASDPAGDPGRPHRS